MRPPLRQEGVPCHASSPHCAGGSARRRLALEPQAEEEIRLLWKLVFGKQGNEEKCDLNTVALFFLLGLWKNPITSVILPCKQPSRINIPVEDPLPFHFHECNRNGQLFWKYWKMESGKSSSLSREWEWIVCWPYASCVNKQGSFSVSFRDCSRPLSWDSGQYKTTGIPFQGNWEHFGYLLVKLVSHYVGTYLTVNMFKCYQLCTWPC